MADGALSPMPDLHEAESIPEAARAEVARMCEGLLANTVIEKYSIEIA